MMKIKKQLGYFAPNFRKIDTILFLAVVGVFGWCAIEVIIWLFSSIRISIVN